MDYKRQVDKLSSTNFIQARLSLFRVFCLLTPKKDELYEWLVMIFGLTNTLNRIMQVSTRANIEVYIQIVYTPISGYLWFV